ncbi:hypothetical protein ARMGADRAFT_1086692 [Armillaria gallica]|uniref:Uncharacterized protein n=1 Tax=Armillaria gallica TaxID=47427 RepID=A0A2H3D5Y6_ARMGA|nr:hypothetical protein ARMGADRAFT_1086692 [Armillaria gallica]
MQFSIFQHLRAISTSVCGGTSSPSMSRQGYVPLGPPTHSNGGSSGNGGGAAQKPKPGTGSGGQTNSSAGSTKIASKGTCVKPPLLGLVLVPAQGSQPCHGVPCAGSSKFKVCLSEVPC